MFLPTLPVRVWLVGALLIVGSGLAFYLVLGRGAKSTLTDQLLSQELIIARSEAGNISSFFQNRGSSIAALSQLGSLEYRNEKSLQDLDNFVKQWSSDGLIGGIILTDKNGVVQLNSNVAGTRDVGDSVADRDYFLWAKSQARPGEFFIGQPVISRLGPSKGQIIIPVATPVFQKGVFAGVMAASVELHPLTEHYLGLMKISDLTEMYLIDQKGDLFYNSSAPDAVGSNIFESLQDNPFLGSQAVADGLKVALASTVEGKLQAASRLIAYSPALLGSRNWLLVIASPIQETVDFSTPIYTRQALVLLLVSAAILTFGVVVAREVGQKSERAKG